MDIPQPLIFLGILLIIPLQIYLSPSKSSDLDYYTSQFKTKVAKIWEEYTSSTGEEDDDLDEEILLSKKLDKLKVEVSEKIREELNIPDYIEKKDYFGGGETPRDPRPPHIKFHVGDIVYHKLNKYRGVIIGWDETPKAPEFWLSTVRGPKKDRDDKEPNYAVLIDTRFRHIPQLAYVPERNIERVETTSKIYHPLVQKYFERYNPQDATYIPRPILRQVYPNDRP